MPFITEKIYRQYFRKNEKEKSIHISKWPEFNKKILEKWTENDIKTLRVNRWFLLTDIISKIRSAKTEAKKSMNAEIILTLESKIYSALKDLLQDLKHVTNAREIKEGAQFKVEFL